MFNNIIISLMRNVKFILAFLAIGIMMSACEFSPEEIQPVGDIILENETGGSGEYPRPTPKPDNSL